MSTSDQIRHYSDLGRKYLPRGDKPLIPPYGPFTISDTAPLQGDGSREDLVRTASTSLLQNRQKEHKMQNKIRTRLMLRLPTGLVSHFKVRKKHGAPPDNPRAYYYRCVHCGARFDGIEGPDRAEAHFRREHSMYLARIPPGYPLGSVVCRLLPDGTWARGRLEGILDCQATCRYLLDVAWDKATLGGHRVGLTVATFNDFRLAVLPPDQLGQVEDALAEAKVALEQIPCVSLVGAMRRGPLVEMQVALRSLSYTGEAVRR